jgi:hypothetical protein
MRIGVNVSLVTVILFVFGVVRSGAPTWRERDGRWRESSERAPTLLRRVRRLLHAQVAHARRAARKMRGGKGDLFLQKREAFGLGQAPEPKPFCEHWQRALALHPFMRRGYGFGSGHAANGMYSCKNDIKRYRVKLSVCMPMKRDSAALRGFGQQTFCL